MAKRVYPEHDKLAAVHAESQPIGTFLDWLQCEKGVILPERIEVLLAEYFEINLDLIEMEKRVMLSDCRRAHKERSHSQ